MHTRFLLTLLLGPICSVFVLLVRINILLYNTSKMFGEYIRRWCENLIDICMSDVLLSYCLSAHLHMHIRGESILRGCRRESWESPFFEGCQVGKFYEMCAECGRVH